MRRSRRYSLYKTQPRGIRKYVWQCTALFLIIAGGYVLLLTQSPGNSVISRFISSEIDLDTTDDATDNRNRIQISKINLEVPFYSDGGAELLELGSWHRYAERGDPKKGGNFILSAHRFTLGNSPSQTKTKSPFYNINKLAIGDQIRVFFHGTWYDYAITKMYDVKPNATEIEAPSDEAKLTLYTCTLKGSADGRTVVEARLE